MTRRPARPTPRRLRATGSRPPPAGRDIDVYGHMNNARYFELIDTVVNNHLVDGDRRRHPRAAGDRRGRRGVAAATSREVGYPEPVDLGVVVDKVGRSSVVYRVGLFQGDGRRGGRRGPVRARVRRQHRPGPPGRRRCPTRSAPRSSRCCAPEPLTDVSRRRASSPSIGVARAPSVDERPRAPSGVIPPCSRSCSRCSSSSCSPGWSSPYVAFPHRGEDVPGGAVAGRRDEQGRRRAARRIRTTTSTSAERHVPAR